MSTLRFLWDILPPIVRVILLVGPALCLMGVIALVGGSRS